MKKILKYKNKILVLIIILLILITSLILFYKLDNDGMNNYNIYNIKYKVYQNNKWSNKEKNGITIGDKENPIQNISISVKDKEGRVYFSTYTNNWSKQIYDEQKENSSEIYGVKFNTTNTLHRKYKICYRTYNKKDKWLNWSCEGIINGNKEEPITAIEIKIIPRNGIKFDYLKNYNEALDANKNF